MRPLQALSSSHASGLLLSSQAPARVSVLALGRGILMDRVLYGLPGLVFTMSFQGELLVTVVAACLSGNSMR